MRDYCNVLFGKIQKAVIGHMYAKVKRHDIRLHTVCFIVAGYSRIRFSYLIGNQPVQSGMVNKEPGCGSTTTVSVAMGRLFTVPQDRPDQEPSVSGLHFDSNFINFHHARKVLEEINNLRLTADAAGILGLPSSRAKKFSRARSTSGRFFCLLRQK